MTTTKLAALVLMFSTVAAHAAGQRTRPVAQLQIDGKAIDFSDARTMEAQSLAGPAYYLTVWGDRNGSPTLIVSLAERGALTSADPRTYRPARAYFFAEKGAGWRKIVDLQREPYALVELGTVILPAHVAQGTDAERAAFESLVAAQARARFGVGSISAVGPGGFLRFLLSPFVQVFDMLSPNLGGSGDCPMPPPGGWPVPKPFPESVLPDEKDPNVKDIEDYAGRYAPGVAVPVVKVDAKVNGVTETECICWKLYYMLSVTYTVTFTVEFYGNNGELVHVEKRGERRESGSIGWFKADGDLCAPPSAQEQLEAASLVREPGPLPPPRICEEPGMTYNTAAPSER